MSTTNDVVKALDNCLAAMAEEGLDARAAAARFPEVADELSPLLATAADLGALRALPTPSAAFRARLAADLAVAPPPRAARDARARSGRAPWRRLRRSLLLATAGLAAVLAFVAVGAVNASASALPGEPLYAVKRRVESVRLRLSSDQAVSLHLGYADRRLAEAVAAPGYGGLLLADFSREVTAALVEADLSLQRGAPRGEVVEPLLAWLVACRGRLVAARPQLMPTAWRAALALVDEAIAALGTDRTLSSAPVPRMADASALLRAHWLTAGGWPVADVPWIALTADRPRPRVGLVAPTPVRRQATPRGLTLQQPTPVAWSGEGSSALLAVVPAQAAVQASPSAEPATAVAPSDPPRTAEAPTPDAPATRERPTTPAPKPTATATAPVIATPSATTIAPTDAPPPTGTTDPVPTPTTGAPAISYLACRPQTVEVYGQSRCEVGVDNPAGGQLAYTWSTDWGVMQQADQPVAIFQAVLSMGGISKFDVPVRVRVRDARGIEVSGETVVFVIPRLTSSGTAGLAGTRHSAVGAPLPRHDTRSHVR